jgi:hypothetical protein
MKTAVIELHYLPCIAYFSSISSFEEITVERYEHFNKQTFRNRCHINTANGRETLVIPLTSKHGKTLITDIKIDYNQKWLNNHWRTIQSAYGKAPFFPHYSDELHDVLYKRYVFLYELNLNLLTLCLKWLSLKIKVSETLSFEKVDLPIKDLRNVINAKKPTEGNNYYQSYAYYQVFGSMFEKNLSIIDAVFCEGPAARMVVEGSKAALNK